MKLPTTERREVVMPTKKITLIHGKSFTGKTTFANSANVPLLINTDGNYDLFDAPYVHISNTDEKKGHITIKNKAWSNFLKLIQLLETEDHGFKTIALDLMEDLYEYADEYYGDTDKTDYQYVKAIKRIAALDVDNVIMITRSKTVNGVEVPNLNKYITDKLSSVAHIVGQVVIKDGVRVLTYEQSENALRGVRIPTTTTEIKLDITELDKVYGGEPVEIINVEVEKYEPQPEPETVKEEPEKKTEQPTPTIIEAEEIEEVKPEPVTEKEEPKEGQRRRRKRRPRN